MITLTHHRSSGRVFASHEARPNALYDVSRMYIAGKKPPQFPVPSVIIDVKIYDRVVVLDDGEYVTFIQGGGDA